PPALLHPDGTVEFLDRATDPPLGARPEHVARPEAETAFEDGATLVLYTDGLVERRREDIDVGLGRLADCLTRHVSADAERLVDTVLAELIPRGGNSDDTAVVIIRL
ncbi:PP2C family protein-serine/threonine phosphatase, partial [Streptomyces sp. NPDC056728]